MTVPVSMFMVATARELLDAFTALKQSSPYEHWSPTATTTPTGTTTSTRNTTAYTTPNTTAATNSQHDHVTPEEPHPIPIAHIARELHEERYRVYEAIARAEQNPENNVQNLGVTQPVTEP
jgi:hypothetical protein